MRLIDANILEPHEQMEPMGNGMYEYVEVVYKDDIDDAPTIDAVQVVRCKDCKHRDLFSCPLMENDFQKDEDYCSWGERKGGDSE